MSVLRFQNCLLVSHSEKRARKIEFHPSATVLKGSNDTGKSSIVKSLYQALGADPAKESPRWKKAHVACLLTFTLDGIVYRAYRRDKTYALFKGESLIGKFTSVSTGLAPALAELLNFQLKLPNRSDGKMVTPPSAYMFLPFYCDQDKGWTDTWISFDHLSQFSNWKKEVISYHTGMRSSAYYEAMETRAKAQADAVEPAAERLALGQMLSKQQPTADVESEIDPVVFKKEIDELLAKHNSLAQRREAYRRKLSELNAKRIQLQAQKDILEKVRTELNSDYEFALEKLPDDAVECPTCGQIHENSFTERFSIAHDEANASDFIAEISGDLVDVLTEIEKEKMAFAAVNAQAQEIQELLLRKHKEVTFKDIVRREGEKEYRQKVTSRIGELDQMLGGIHRTADEAGDAMKLADSADKREEILDRYRFLMATYLRQLKVDGLVDNDYRNIDFRIKETGSDAPRAILAYMFAILDLMRTSDNTPDCPIILDSPKQQDQDDANHEALLRFIKGRRAHDSQLILCLVDDAGIDFGGDIIELTNEKLWLLSKDEYTAHSGEIARFENLVFS